MVEHRDERSHAGAPGDQLHRPPFRAGACPVVGPFRPDEVAADRTAQLEEVVGPQLVGQVGRYLAVVEPLDQEVQLRELGRRGQRVAALRAVAVFRGQADVDVLAGQVAGPVRDVEHQTVHPGRLGPVDAYRGPPPAQPPLSRYPRHGR